MTVATGPLSHAALCVTAALGVLAICGSGVAVVVTTALVLAVLFLAPRLEHQLPPKHQAAASPSPSGRSAA